MEPLTVILLIVVFVFVVGFIWHCLSLPEPDENDKLECENYAMRLKYENEVLKRKLKEMGITPVFDWDLNPENSRDH